MISIVREGDTARVGTLTSSEVDPVEIEGLVRGLAGGRRCRRRSPRRRAAARAATAPRPTGTRRRRAPAPRCSPTWPGSLSRGFRRQRPAVRLRPSRAGDGVSGDLDGIAAPLHPADRFGGDQRQTRRRQRVGRRWVPLTSPMCQRIALLEQLSTRLGWAKRTRRAARRPLRDDAAAVGGGGHDDLPGLVDGRSRRAGGPHRAVSLDGGTRVGERLTDLPLTLYSDPAAPGLELHAVRGGRQFVGDGVGFRQRHGHRPGGLDPRRRDQRAGLPAGRGRGVSGPVAVAADNLLMTGGSAGLGGHGRGHRARPAA